MRMPRIEVTYPRNTEHGYKCKIALSVNDKGKLVVIWMKLHGAMELAEIAKMFAEAEEQLQEELQARRIKPAKP